jgi:hypothetical protein
VKIKNLALVAAAALGMAGTNAAFACSTAAWAATTGGGETGNPVEGRPTDAASPVARYSGQCGLKATTAGNFVTDGTPAAETAFRARFYVYTGLASGNAVVYRARNGAGADQITVTYNRDTGNLLFAIPGTPTGTPTAPVAPNAWYSVELAWAQAGTLNATVRGAGVATDSTVALTGGTAGGVIETAQLGFISGSGVSANTGTAREGIITDAYESRRSTAIGRLCRGDANGSNTITVGDAVQILNESFPGGPLTSGQPDCNENGSITVGDAVCALNRSFIASVCTSQP